MSVPLQDKIWFYLTHRTGVLHSGPVLQRHKKNRCTRSPAHCRRRAGQVFSTEAEVGCQRHYAATLLAGFCFLKCGSRPAIVSIDSRSASQENTAKKRAASWSNERDLSERVCIRHDFSPTLHMRDYTSLHFTYFSVR